MLPSALLNQVAQYVTLSQVLTLVEEPPSLVLQSNAFE